MIFINPIAEPNMSILNYDDSSVFMSKVGGPTFPMKNSNVIDPHSTP